MPLGQKPAPMPPGRSPRLHVGVDKAKGADRTVWLAGIWVEGDTWEVLGVFDAEAKADAACTEHNHFYGPVVLNRRYPDETIEWDGQLFPRAQK